MYKDILEDYEEEDYAEEYDYEDEDDEIDEYEDIVELDEKEYSEDAVEIEKNSNSWLKPDSEIDKKNRVKHKTKPDIIRASFITYLRDKFVYGYNWIHPTEKKEFSNSLIRDKLEIYKNLNKTSYRALWCLWASQQSRAFIADHFNFSGSTIKRRWNKSIDTILLMLLYPELHPDIAINLYKYRS